jgi:hypothetical protein
MTANVEATMVALRGLLEGHHARLEAESMVGSPWLNALSVNLQTSGIACQIAQNCLVAVCFLAAVFAQSG